MFYEKFFFEIQQFKKENTKLEQDFIKIQSELKIEKDLNLILNQKLIKLEVQSEEKLKKEKGWK